MPRARVVHAGEDAGRRPRLERVTGVDMRIPRIALVDTNKVQAIADVLGAEGNGNLNTILLVVRVGSVERRVLVGLRGLDLERAARLVFEHAVGTQRHLDRAVGRDTTGEHDAVFVRYLGSSGGPEGCHPLPHNMMLRRADLPRTRGAGQVVRVGKGCRRLEAIDGHILNVNLALACVEPDLVEVRIYREEMNGRHAADALVAEIDLDLDILLQNDEGLGSGRQVGSGGGLARDLAL